MNNWKAGFWLAIPVLLLLVSGTAISGKKKENFIHDDYDSYQVRTIGVLEWGYREFDDEATKIMKAELERSLRPFGYNFSSQVVFQKTARNANADSLLDLLQTQWISEGGMSPKLLREFGEKVHVDAVLASYLDTWERDVIDHNVRGTSRTEIGARHALYSTKTGDLLWATVIYEEGQGPYNDPQPSNVVGINRSGIGTEVRTSTALDPPTYEEVAAKVGETLQKKFPPPPKIEEPVEEAEETKPARGAAEEDDKSDGG